MTINRDTITEGLKQLLDKLFSLPEVRYAKVRDVMFHRNNYGTQILEAVDKSYHDCCSDIDLSVLVRISPKEI